MINNYACSVCGDPTPRKDLSVKKVTFLEMGAGARTIRSRVAEWMCPSCRKKDEDWNREPFQIPVKISG